MVKLFDFLAVAAFALLIFWLSGQPAVPVPQWFAHQDKLLHLGAYFVFGLLVWRALRHVIRRPIVLAWLSIAVGSLYGASDEWHQAHVPGRTPDVADWLADTVGVGLAVLVIYQARRLWLK